MHTIKQLLKAHSIIQSELARELNVSAPLLNLFINHGQLPKRNPEQFLTRVTKLLTNKGIADADIQNALKTAERATTTNADTPAHQPHHSQSEDDLMILHKMRLKQPAKEAFGIFQSDLFTADVQTLTEMFLSREIRSIRQYLESATKSPQFVAVIGESGSGKTTIKDDFIDNILNEERPVVVIQPTVRYSEDNNDKGKKLKAESIAESIIYALAPTQTPKRSIVARDNQMIKLLEESHKAGNTHILVIEEAHSLSTITLKHLKRFFEIKLGRKNLISIMLLGQPELENKLSPNDQTVREVVQRIEIIKLKPLTEPDLSVYLQHRCNKANLKLSDLIDESGLNAIAERLRGRLYPLAIGNLFTRALNLAAELGLPIVSEDIVKNVKATNEV